MITKDGIEPDEVTEALTVLAKVRKLIADGNTDLSLDDLLNKAQVTDNEYTNTLELSCRGSVVLLQREPHECNNYNPSVMLAWQANMDI